MPKKGHKPNEKQRKILDENRVSWKKGVSGNPAGKPVGIKNRETLYNMFVDLIHKSEKGELISHPDNPEKKLTKLEVIALRAIDDATKGDKDARRDVFDGLFGKMKEVHEIIPPDINRKEVEEMTDEEAEAAYDSALKG